MVEREKALFYGVCELWGDLGSGGARGFRAGVAHKLAHWTAPPRFCEFPCAFPFTQLVSPTNPVLKSAQGILAGEPQSNPVE